MKKKIPIAILLLITAFGITAQAAWYDEELGNCKSKGFVAAELFENPNEYITRGEVCELLVSYYERKNPTENISVKENTFEDISSTEYKNAIQKAYSLGIISGMTNTEFAPDNNITREQFVCLIHRLNNSPIAETFLYYDANEISDYALSAIDYSVANKIVMGTEKGYFSPKANITKAQAIIIVNRLDDNVDIATGDKTFSEYKLRSETKDYISYIVRKFDVTGYRIMLSRGMTMERQPDVLVILDKNTGKRKFVELEKIVSLHFFDIGDTLYIPICKVSASNISDSWTQGMYIVDKKTRSVEEVETPVFVEAFALANGCIYYQTSVKTGERSYRPTISKYNLETKEITMSKQGAIGEFDGNIILYISEEETICRRCVDNEDSIYTIDMDTLEMEIISYEPIIAINENYYIKLTDDERPYAALCDRKTDKIIRNISLDDEACLVTEESLTKKQYNDTYYINAYYMRDFVFYNVNGELYVRYKDNEQGYCITNDNMFNMDFFYSFFNNAYTPDNSYYRNDRAFYLTNTGTLTFMAHYGVDMPREDAAVASLYSRKTYGTDKALDFIIDTNKKVREFSAEYKRKYKNPYDLIRAINNYLTFDCDYDDATYAGLPTDRKYSAFYAPALIIEKSGVCGGYADTVKKVLYYAGIKCEYIVGEDGDHAWNLIEIDGKKYFIDSTWNSNYRDPDAYYMMSYEEISQDHKTDDGWLYLVE